MAEITKEKKEKLFNIINDMLGVDASNITDTSKIQEDLGADSLDEVELVMEVEKQFSITVPDSVLENIKVVSDFYPLI